MQYARVIYSHFRLGYECDISPGEPQSDSEEPPLVISQVGIL